eukprot:19201-Heterococcus_DN1.PRE.1
MVMVDRMWSPQPFPLVHQHHIVSYDIGDEKTFFKLHYYSTHEQAARIIAARGLYHALRFMSPVTTVDYVLCTAEQLNGRDRSYIRTGPAILKDIDSLCCCVASRSSTAAVVPLVSVTYRSLMYESSLPKTVALAANIHQRSCQCSPRYTTTARQMN